LLKKTFIPGLKYVQIGTLLLAIPNRKTETSKPGAAGCRPNKRRPSMGFSHITTQGAAHGLDQVQRRENEARAAALYAIYQAAKRAISTALRVVVEPISRARRARRAKKTYRVLNALSDRQLRDIGLNRAEIEFLAEAVAMGSPWIGFTVEELRRSGRLPFTRNESSIASPQETPGQTLRLTPRTGTRMAPTSPAEQDRAAA
jgi:uncharacterized protein YjiS (DUF1127 family)